MIEMDKETEILSRVTINHLFLAQFEPFRATLLSLRARNPDLALAILQTVVSNGARFPNIVWSTDSSSCPSPSLFTWLATLELIQFHNCTSSVWTFDPQTLQLRVEFLLLVQLLSSRVSESIGLKKVESVSVGIEGIDEKEEVLKGRGDVNSLRNGLVDSVRVFDRISALGLKRLKPNVAGVNGEEGVKNDVLLEESELGCLKSVILENADLLDALCCNIETQVKGRERACDHTGLAITVGNVGSEKEEEKEEEEKEDSKVLHSVKKCVQRAHLDVINECLEDGDVDGAILNVRYLHFGFGLAENYYRMVLENVLRKILSNREGFGDAWNVMRQRLGKLYEEACSSNCNPLVQMIQAIQDDLLFEEIEMHKAHDSNPIPPPLEKFQRNLDDLTNVKDLSDKSSFLQMAIHSCLGEMYHYARVSGLHLLECVMDTALSAVTREQFQEASNILMLYPRLHPLVAVMGWDLLSGKTLVRRKLMQLLWIGHKSEVRRLEESSLYGDQSDEKSCVEHLCDSLCYQLDLASFVACVNSGRSWNSKFSVLMSAKEQLVSDDKEDSLDPFVENFVLERLSVQSPLRVLFDLVPGIKVKDAIELVSMQPIASTLAAWKKMEDIELMRMRYALESTVLALGFMGRSMIDESNNDHLSALFYLKDLRHHLEAISDIPRKILMVNVIISLLHMDGISTDITNFVFPGNYSEFLSTYALDYNDLAPCEEGNKLVISFTRLLLDILRDNCLAVEQEPAVSGGVTTEGRQALEWRIRSAKRFIEDWEWRLSVLQRFLPLSDRQWTWKEALTLLHAAPSKLLNLCMQRAKYDIGEEAINRFSLPPEDRAVLELAEWVDRAFTTASVEKALSNAADGTAAGLDLDFSSLRIQLGPLATILLSIDVAATSARSSNMSQQLLNQAQVMLSEIYPGSSPKMSSTYWDQIHEVGVISVTRKILKRLHDFLEQDSPPALQAILSGEIIIPSTMDSRRKVQRERALGMLHQMIEDAHRGKRQFLSGKLHNLARAVTNEEIEKYFSQDKGVYTDQKALNFDTDGVFGLGLRAAKQTRTSSTAGENNMQSAGYDTKDTEKRSYGSLNAKPTTYLSQFILHIAAIGDIVDGTDTTHDFNFFSIVYEWPKDLLTRLVFDRGSTDAAGKVAEIMSADFVHEVISACVPPVYPPRVGHGWACIPVTPTYPKSPNENRVLSPSAKQAKPNCYIRSSATPGLPLYPLELDIVKHLVKLSPVRAVLACVFGGSILYNSSDSAISSSFNDDLLREPDANRLFYEFALDQSERFPTLNRWIQMQTNLHRVSEVATTAEDTTTGRTFQHEERSAMKRFRDHDSDSESEDDTVYTNISTMPLAEHSSPDLWHDSPETVITEPNETVFLSFDWENEGPYEKAVERLMNEGNLMDALALSDRFLRNGASDRLLQLIIEHEEQITSIPGQSQSYGGRRVWSDSWQYCLRLKDKRLAAKLSLKYLHGWEMDAALDILTMCSCHLLEDDPVKFEVFEMRQALQRYKLILCSDDHYSSWQEVEAECKEDPEGLALRLAGKGAVSAALEVAESAELSKDLRRELKGRQLVKLLTADPLNGGGPAEASRFLSSLRDSDDALPVAMEAMQLLPNLRSKQLLVHFFLKRKDGNLSDAEVSRLNSWALGLRVLAALPLPWQQRCSSLHEHPHLILEVLLMRKQLQSASLILKEFPSLRDNNVVIAYAAKAIAVSISVPSRESRISVSGSRPRQKTRAGAPTRSSFTNSLNNLQKEARRAFSWTPRNAGEKSDPKDVYRKRKSSGLTPSEKVAWEVMTGIQEDHILTYPADGQERLPSVSIAEEWILTGDRHKDEAVRSAHRYETAPDIILFKALLSLCSEESVSAKGALELCINQMNMVLSSQQVPENASMENIGRAYHATETFVLGLMYAKSQLRKLAGGSELPGNSERFKDLDDASSDAGSSSVGSQSTDEPLEVLSQAEVWLGRAELLQSLLGSGIAASLDDIADKESSARLRNRLIVDERYSMAVYTCKKCKIDVFPVWIAWGHALIRMEHYAQARVKFKQALQVYKGDPAPIILDIINTIEGGPPVDVSAVRSMYEHFARSAPTILDDSLSADSYLNILYMPSTFPRSERSRRSQESVNNNSINCSEFEDGPRSNLESSRYNECASYLEDYARQHLLNFMFRHGQYEAACLLFFPQDDVPSPPQLLPQRPDPLATDYGTIDDLCDLCIGHGAMTILEEVLTTRVSSTTVHDADIKQYTDAALARICIYCETHRHFNYLYKFQVIRKDHVAAGLCCIQLYMNSSLQEEAIKHLQHAKMHFDEGLSARYKAGESTKLVTKGVRGKSASEKLSEEGLVKFSARVSIQVDVIKSFNDSEGPQWKHSLFGNPNDPETFRRRCEIAETLVEKNYDLAFQLIYEFALPAVDIYAGVAASLAERKRVGQLTEFFKNIKGTINVDDWDQVLGAAINVYANKHKERPDRLIDMLTSNHRKVLACVVCGRLKSAFQIASKSGSVADVQYVAHQALHANALPVLDMCKQWLSLHVV